jgi:hypothetical protein
MKLKDLARVWREYSHELGIDVIDDKWRLKGLIVMQINRNSDFWTCDNNITYYEYDGEGNCKNKQDLGTNYDYKNFNEIGEKIGLKDLENYYVLGIRDYSIQICKTNLLRG